MQIKADIVGRPLAAQNRVLNWRDTMNFAASVEDVNPWYLNDTRPEGILVPPLYAFALSWPLVTSMQSEAGDAIDPQIFMRMVHAGEHLLFKRPITPADNLTLSGVVADLRNTKAGAIVTARIEAVDSDGEAVFVEYSSALFRKIEAESEAHVGDPLPAFPAMGAEAPDWEQDIEISRSAPYHYDAATQIVFPIHTSHVFARSVGLGGTIYQGGALLARAAATIVDREGDGKPWTLREIACRFGDMVIPGTPVVVQGQRIEGMRGGFTVLNDRKRPAITGGFVLNPA